MTNPTERPAAQATRKAEDVLTEHGVFKGAHGLRGLLNADAYWDGRPYGTRLNYGSGIADYLHRDVLRAAVNALDALAAPSPATGAQALSDDEVRAIHRLPYVRALMLDYVESPKDATADAAVKAIAAQVTNLLAAAAPADPCPQCKRGRVCKTPACGRLRSSELMRLYGTDAAPSAPAAEVDANALPPKLQIDLTEEQSEFLRSMLCASLPPPEITLSIGNGHSGYGLYAWESEYPDEGANLVAEMAAPAPEQAAPDMPHWPIVYALSRVALCTHSAACLQHVERLTEALQGTEYGPQLQELIDSRPKPGDFPPARVVHSGAAPDMVEVERLIICLQGASYRSGAVEDDRYQRAAKHAEEARDALLSHIRKMAAPAVDRNAPNWRPFGLTLEGALNRGDSPALLMDENSPIRGELRRLLAEGAPREHVTSPDCWCEPEVDYIDPDTGATVYVHKGQQ